MKLDADGFPYTINYENNLVLYKINHEKCIRLSYMLYLLVLINLLYWGNKIDKNNISIIYINLFRYY